MADESTDLIKRRRLLIFPGVALGVFIPGALVIISFIVFGAVFTDTAGGVFDAVQDVVTDGFGWFYAVVVTAFLVFIIWLALSSYGSIRLGMPNERPEFSYLGWFAMLFSAGMGIGLLFWSVAEPVAHFGTPPTELARDEQSSVVAMRYTFFHWGLHAWAVYIIMGLCLAYFALPPSSSRWPSARCSTPCLAIASTAHGDTWSTSSRSSAPCSASRPPLASAPCR
ncbi:MAG: BCCT family transporter [Dehalococcoidia bacterium]|nr:BCCT family transporter [Dehalococcoidia bacterium]